MFMKTRVDGCSTKGWIYIVSVLSLYTMNRVDFIEPKMSLEKILSVKV